MEKILLNKIQCVHCGEIMESKDIHDFKMCECGACGLDGGLMYLRRIGTPDDYIELSIVEKYKLEDENQQKKEEQKEN